MHLWGLWFHPKKKTKVYFGRLCAVFKFFILIGELDIGKLQIWRENSNKSDFSGKVKIVLCIFLAWLIFDIVGSFDLCRGWQVLPAAGGFRLSTNDVFSSFPLLLFFSFLVFSSVAWQSPPRPPPRTIPLPCTPDTSVLLSSQSLLSVWSVLTQGSIQALIKETSCCLTSWENSLLCI